jgi:hypothetical protein
MSRQRVRLKDLSEHDRREVALFKKFLRAAGAKPTPSRQREAYADTYGELIYDAKKVRR